MGGQLLNLLHPQWCFLINALSYLAVLWALAQMDISGTAKLGKEAGGLRTVLDGLNFILGRRNILLLVLLMAATSFCGWSIRALLPALAAQLGSDNSGYGWMMGGIGLGALAAAREEAGLAIEIRERLGRREHVFKVRSLGAFRLILRASAAVETRIAGVDILYDRSGAGYVIEVNGVPGWRALARVTKCDIAHELIDSLEHAHQDG